MSPLNLDVACVLDGYGYEPRLARMVIETIAEIKDEKVFTVMFAIWIDGAREEVNRN